MHKKKAESSEDEEMTAPKVTEKPLKSKKKSIVQEKKPEPEPR